MFVYIHKVHYYETDKMGIAHHSNYVRWMEEARMAFLTSIGYGMKKLEESGVTSPVVSVEVNYRRPCTYDDEIAIEVSIEKYSGVRFDVAYAMRKVGSGEEVANARSSHCFITPEGRPVAVKRSFPDFDAALRAVIEADGRESAGV